jgi:hypothetical protein
VGSGHSQLTTVDVFDRSISEVHAHLEVKICKERMWKLCVVQITLSRLLKYGNMCFHSLSFFRCHEINSVKGPICLKNKKKDLTMLLKLCGKEWYCILLPRILMFYIVCYVELFSVMVDTNPHSNSSLFRRRRKMTEISACCIKSALWTFST